MICPARFNLWEKDIIVGDKYVALTPGMSVTVEIKTGNRKLHQLIMNWLLEHGIHLNDGKPLNELVAGSAT